MQPLIPPERPPRPWIDRVVQSRAVRSGYLSLAVHLVVCILLALWAGGHRPRAPQRPLLLSVGPATESEAADAADAVAGAVEIGADAPPAPTAVAAAGAGTEGPPLEPVEAQPELSPLPAAALMAVPREDAPAETAIADPLETARVAKPVSTRGSRQGSIRGGSPPGPPFAPRRGSDRAAAVRGRGGTPASEAAVARGLEWLALHQAVDGSWRFDLSGCRCNGACRDPGSLTSSTASTAIALLPFLGAGHTHIDGRHQETVSRGLYYLLSRMERTPRGGDFSEGTMYGHGVTALVLTEAFGMTRDDSLARPAQDALRFIESAQDLHGGGWRYLPGQAGDVTVTAWQLAALKSGQLAGLEVSSPTFDGVRRFLDRVQSQSGAAYGYRSPAAKPSTSSIGLLCRMYLGWGPEQAALERGLTMLAKPGPAPSAVYQNFYLAQALLQSDHPAWPRWNAKNRDQLVAQQIRMAHEAGSWFFADHDTAPGGRLAHTSLAILTLEVYYRLLPIYGQEAVESGY